MCTHILMYTSYLSFHLTYALHYNWTIVYAYLYIWDSSKHQSNRVSTKLSMTKHLEKDIVT